jgi:hypothetical protein
MQIYGVTPQQKRKGHMARKKKGYKNNMKK